MGRISGDLAVLGIANLFQALSVNPRGGLLTVSRGDEKKSIQCDPQGLRLLAATRRVSPLGQILLRTRKVTREQLGKILADQPGSGMPLGEYVTKSGLVSAEDIEQALRAQVADEIYDLFTWAEGHFEFQEYDAGAEPRGDDILSSVRLDQSVMFIALEAARRMDHLAHIRDLISDERLVPVALEIPMAENEAGLDRDSLTEILPFVNGKRSVAQIIEECLYPRFSVLMTLHALAQRGSAKIRDVGATDGPETVLLRRTGNDAGAHANGTTIVLAGDQTRDRMSLALFLGNFGYNVLECPTSENLPRLISTSAASALVLEADLGTEAGHELCRFATSKCAVPLLALSTLEGDSAVTRAFQSGAVHVILKPVNSELLVERLAETLKRRGPVIAGGRAGAAI